MQKMLIADDLEINRKALGSIFCEKYEILEAVNGAEVLEILVQNNIDVLLLDLFMPVMDGFEVLEKIAKSKTYKNLSIIVNTVHGEDENEVRALSLGADEFIFKPYNPNLIAHRVENIVEKNRRLKETEENLRLSNEKAQLEIKINSIIDNVPGGIVTIKRLKDGTRVPMFFSDRYCAIWEDTRENLMKGFEKDIMAGVHPDDVEKLQKAVDEAFKNNTEMNINYRIVTAKGNIRWIANRSSIVVQDNDEAIQYVVCTDITGEVEAQNKILKVNKEIEQLYNFIPGAVFRCRNDENWTVVFANDGFYRFVGYTKEEFKQKFNSKFGLIMEKDDLEPMKAKIKIQLKNGNLVSNEVRIICKNEEIKWISIRAEFIKNKQGKEVYYCVFVDITKQKRFEQEIVSRYNDELAYSERRDKATDVASIRFNLTSGVMETCTQNYQFIGLKHEKNGYNLSYEMVSASIPQGKIKDNFRKIFAIENLRSEFANGTEEINFEYPRILKNCRLTWIRTTVKMMKKPNTEEIVAFFYVKDITTEKVSRDIVVHSANKIYDVMMYIVCNANDFICFVRGREPIHLSNFDQYMKMVIKRETVDNEEIKTEEIFELISLETVKRELETKPDYIFTIKTIGHDGKVLFKKHNFSYIDDDENVIIYVQTDISDIYEKELERKEILQEALKNSEQANNAKSMFLSSMSHDIRTPMNAIVGMTQLVINDMDNKEQVRESIGIIDTASKHLLSIINDVLDMSKIENGSLIFAHEQLNLDEEIDSIKEIMLPVLNEKEQTINLDINEITHKCCVGDAIRLRRVMINILNNASKFTQAGGEINVEIKELHNNNPKIALYRFTVSDNGQGIEKHALEHIFEPFYRENSINTKEIEGTGLGLAIVKGIIEAQGGSIDIESEPGKGTTVTMQISFHISEQDCVIKKVTSQNPLLQKVRENFDGLKVLLVEDHPVNTIVAKRLLENCGATVTDVANGSIAYDVFSQSEKDRFDVIFMDIQMPVMNGYEATIAIRNCQHPRAKTIPIIAMTANAFAEDIKKSLDVGMNGHVAKPIDVKNIANAINAVREDIKNEFYT